VNDLWAIVIGASAGILVAPVIALLIVASLRAGQSRTEYVPWSVILVQRELPELPAPASQLALPAAREVQ
jgi:hypothetical protein